MGKSENSWSQRVFGQFSWEKPGWAGPVKGKHILIGFVSLLVVVGGGIGGWEIWKWYQSRPKPDVVTFSLRTPGITPLNKELRPDPVVIQFARSAARIDLIQKPNIDGITISPAIPGEWMWTNKEGSILRFHPKQDWPANQEYQVTFDPTIFANHIKLEKYQTNFKTLPLTATLSIDRNSKHKKEPEQNHQNKTEFQVTATLQFSHPVKTDTIESHLVFEMAENGKKKAVPFTIKFDETKRKVFLLSNTFTLPEQTSFLWVRMSKGIPPAFGQGENEQILEDSVPIQAISDFFKVEKATTLIVKNQAGDPEQVLSVEFSSDMKAAQVTGKLRAYLLPEKKDPESENIILFNSAEEVKKEDIAASKKLELEAIPTNEESSSTVFFRLSAMPKQQLYVEIDSGIRSLDGFVIKNGYKGLLSVPMYPREVQIQHQGSLLSLSGEKKISIMTRGIEGLQIQVGRVLEDRIPYLVTQTRNWGNFQKPTFSRSDEFDENDVAEIFTEVQDLHMKDPSKSIYTVFDFEKYLTQNGKRKQGLFFMKIHAWDIKNNQKLESGGNQDTESSREGDSHDEDGEESSESSAESLASMPMGETHDNRFILISDLGVLVKQNENRMKDVFVQSIASGDPVAGADVMILGRNGLSVTQAKTSTDGHVLLPSLDDLKKEKTPVVYLVKRGADLSFLPYNRQDRKLNYSRFEVDGLRHDNQEAQLRAQVFSDRGIYRPGEQEKIRIGVIVKQETWDAKLEGVPISMNVFDSRGRLVYEERRSLSISGFEEFQFSTQPDSATGDYQVKVYLIKGKNDHSVLGSTTIAVNEFLPDRMKIDTRLTENLVKGWVSAEKVKALVILTQLFGAPAENRKVTARISLSKSSFSFSEYKDYRFADPLQGNLKNLQMQEDLPQQKTDSMGHASFVLPLQKFADASYRLALFAEGFEAEGGRSVSSMSTILVSPLAYLVGIKPDGDFSFIKPKSARTAELIAINPELKKISVSNILAEWKERRYVSTLMKQENGTFKYQSLLQELPVKQETIAWAEEGKKLELLTEKPGDFVIVLSSIMNGKSLELGRVQYTVSGNANLDVSRARDAELKVTLNKKEYQAGEEIEVQIAASYTGAGLISIERDKVYAFKWFKSVTTASQQTITIPANFEGNGYVNVAFVRDLHSKEIFMSPLSYAVIPFRVNREKRTIHLELATKDQVKPGEDLIIQVKSDKPAKAIVFAVDEGILQVAHYQTPDPGSFFMKKRALEVETSQILDLLLPEYSVIKEVSQAGGGESDEMAEAKDALGKNLNPFRRKAEKPVVFWSGIIDVGSDAKELRYAVPDSFAGSLRIMAVAVSADAVGKQEEHVVAKGDFVISPNAPLFIAPSDQVDISVSVFNNVTGSGKDAPVLVSLTPSDAFDIVGNQKQTLPIGEGHESVVHFMVKAKEKLGPVDFVFFASHQDKKARRTISTSIRPAVPYRTKLQSGQIDEKGTELSTSGPLFQEFYKSDLSLSYLPVGLIPGILSYVEEFPYGCSEQTTSKAFSILPLGSWGPSLGVSPQRVKESLNRAMNILLSRQNEQGGIGYWTVSDVEAISFVTVYAAHFLTEAKEQHVEIHAALLKNALGYLKEMVKKTPSSLHEARTLAYAIYVLTRNGEVTSNALLHLKDFLDRQYPEKSIWFWKKDITGAYLAAAYQLMQQSKEAEDLIEKYSSVDEKEEEEPNDFYQPLGTRAQYVLILAKHFKGKLSGLPSQAIQGLVAPISASSYNTLAGAYAAQALFAYGNQIKVKAPSQYDVTLVDALGKKTEIHPSAPLVAMTPIPYQTSKILFGGGSRPYYQLVQSGFSKVLPTSSYDSGLHVIREYKDAKGKQVTSVPVGQEVTVLIRVQSTSKKWVSRVAVVDLLPGGFDVVADSIKAGSGTQGMDFADVREDRVIFFGSFSDTPRELTYRIKATNVGTFQVPPAFAQAMYHPQIESWTAGSSIVVSP